MISMSRFTSIDTATVLATASAVMIIAFQVAGKAVRDAFFLSNYDVTLLPVMLMAASAFSIVTVLLTGRAMSSLSPARFVPLAFLTSALLLLAEWQLSQSFPKAASVAVYFHIAALGGVLVSGFWSIVNERFDPRTAKKRVSWIGAGGAMGGLLGGALAERVGASLSLSSMFPILSLIHLLCAGLLIGLCLPEIGRRHSERTTRKETSTTTWSGLQTLKRVPYLRNLTLLVFLGTASAACIDYVFKTQVVNTYQQGEALMRFFAIFYTATGVLTFLVQISFSRLSLEKLGLGKTAAARSSVLALGGVAALAVPGLAGVVVARSLETILRNSLFRSAYELFFTPLPETEKRSTKSMIDVGSERLGDIAGGAAVGFILIVAPQIANSLIVIVGIISASVGIWVANRLQRGYVSTLEQSLLDQAVDLDLSQVEDRTTRATLVQTMAVMSLSEIPQIATSRPIGKTGSTTARELRDRQKDTLGKETVDFLTTLESGNPEQIKQTLGREILEPDSIPRVIPLLAWDEVTGQATRALLDSSADIRPHLTEVLLDSNQEFTIRRRIPRILATRPSQEVVQVLIQGLRDTRFEVRFQCGLALSRIQTSHPQLAVSREQIFEIVLQEVTVERGIWKSRRLLDELQQGEDSPVVDQVIRNRTDRSLEHVFTVLSLVLPREPLKIAFMGLHTDDDALKGTALEYLDSVLPPDIRTKMWPFLEVEPLRHKQTRSREEVLESLLRSHESIAARLDELLTKDRG